jgi:glycosyltransferase involved in cell wall biosynthesis
LHGMQEVVSSNLIGSILVAGCSMLVAGYFTLSLCYWLRMAYGVLRLRRLPKLSEIDSGAPPRRPKLSVIVPACNEADKIESAVPTILADGYPDLEVVLVDDRSTDMTGKCIDRLAAQDNRITAIHITELPEGWLGKVNALNQGLCTSSGEFVLFTDADVHLKPGTLQKAVAYCLEHDTDHLVACPTVWPSSFVVDSMVAAFVRQFFTLILPPWRINSKSPRAFFGIGAFNLVKRSAFEATEGFEWLRLETADDAGLGLLMKRSGAKSVIVTAFDRIGLHWYRTIGEMMRGAEKGFASAGKCSFARMMLLALAGLIMEISPLIGMLYFICGQVQVTTVLGILVFFAFIFAAAAFASWARGRILPAVLTPATAILSAIMAVRAGWLGWRRKGIIWRGTFYPAELLKKNARVKVW